MGSIRSVVALKDRAELARNGLVIRHAGGSDNQLGAETHGVGGRHGGMNAEFSGGIVAGRNDPTLIGATSDGKGQVAKARIIPHFNRRIEAIHIHMDEFPGECLA